MTTRTKKSHAYTEGSLPEDFEKAFKDADIRGVYPSEIDEVLAYRVARAFVAHFTLKSVVVARDMRLSSPALRDAFVAGVTDAGASVVDLGLLDTPGLYYASGTFDSYGVMITASHNPKHYNGLKLVMPGAVPVTNKTGMLDIKKLVKKNAFSQVPKKGTIKKKSVLAEYGRYTKKVVPIKTERPFRIVADAGNGMASVLSSILDKYPGIEVTKLAFELDGTFPNRESNPTLAKNQKDIVKALKRGEYDLGVSFDGDADRVAFFDENGHYIDSSVIGAYLAAHLLSKYPNEAMIYTIFSNSMYPETIKQQNGKAVRARVGHAFIKEQMKKHDAIFGCEHSAHFYFRDNYYADSGILALLYVLDAFADAHEAGESFSSVIKPFDAYHQTEEILVEVTDKQRALKTVERVFEEKGAERIEAFDGVTVIFPDHRFAVKQSVTEDALKFVVESSDANLAEAKKKDLHGFLRAL